MFTKYLLLTVFMRSDKNKNSTMKHHCILWHTKLAFTIILEQVFYYYSKHCIAKLSTPNKLNYCMVPILLVSIYFYSIVIGIESRGDIMLCLSKYKTPASPISSIIF